MNIRIFIAMALLFISQSIFSATTQPHIVILATGGTIAGTAASTTQTSGYKSGEIGVQTLINAVPEIKNIARVDGQQIANIGSENMTSDIILKLSQQVNTLLARDDVDGVVITHGTDTLDETAYFLNLTVKSDKPVVFTAAMRPATAISADGAMNLLEAVTVAADPNARGRGVMVVLNDRIGSARFVTKTNATTLDTFKAPEQGYLGVIVNGKPQFETRVEKVHTLRSVFDVRNLRNLPKVVIIYGYQDDPEYMYDAAISHHVDGIIYAGTGAGSVSVRSEAGIKKAEKAGIIVIRSSRTGNGVVPADKGQPGLVADSLNPAKARILLMTALTQTKNPELIQHYFSTY
ncbi:fructose-asparagine asparaginase [Trabulsiella odontotermitis]|uniref:fructose-asparagine asparaginase n=1 Tax=Trabulsiella odontotermitis TaxID=379893 RepID=UPI0024B7504B|nr:fructose-asparagine asparaginase [Trabulsiella odontotermitis]WHP32252.1 fructose-asparagine asparaginase [Trabulsiella odontotermitis]